MQYSIGVCDDEIYQIKVNLLYLKEFAKKNKYKLKYAGFDTAKKVLDYLENNILDILLLDIDLKSETGIELAMKLMKLYPKMVIIFVTGHREFACEAFDVDAMGYIVKPIEMNRLETVLKKTLLQVQALNNLAEDVMLTIIEESTKKKLKQKNIVLIRRELSKSVIYTMQTKHEIYEPLKSLEERLDNKIFLRVNQGEIINMNHIIEIKGNKIFTKNNEVLYIGRTYKKKVLETYF